MEMAWTNMTLMEIAWTSITLDGNGLDRYGMDEQG